MYAARILLVSAAAGGLAAVAGLAAIPSADAAVLTGGQLTLAGSSFYAGDCSSSTGDPTDVTAPVVAGDTVTRTQSISLTGASAADPTDKVTLHGTEKVTVSSTVSGGQLSTFRVTTTASGSVTLPKGAASVCRGTSADTGSGWNLRGGVQASMHRTTAGWAHVTVHSTGSGAQGGTLGLEGSALQSTAGAVAVRNVDDDQWVYVPAGDYSLQSQSIAAVTTGGFPTASEVTTISLAFAPAGIARAAETGGATSMVAFPAGLTCSTGRASVRFTSAIVGAGHATVYVNGTAKRSVNSPRATSFTVPVPKDRAVTLKAVVTRKSTSYIATRSYRSC